MLTRSQKAQSRLTGQEERGRALSPTLALPSAGRHMTPGGLPLSLAAAISCSEVADSIQPILENTNVRGEEGWGGVGSSRRSTSSFLLHLSVPLVRECRYL